MEEQKKHNFVRVDRLQRMRDAAMFRCEICHQQYKDYTRDRSTQEEKLRRAGIDPICPGSRS